MSNTPTVSPVTGAGGANEFLPPDQRRGAVEKITGGTAIQGFGKDPGFQPPFDPLERRRIQLQESRASIAMFRSSPSRTPGVCRTSAARSRSTCTGSSTSRRSSSTR